MATDVTATVRAVIAVVDQATAPLRAIQGKVEGTADAMRGAGQAMAESFKGVDTSLQQVGTTLGDRMRGIAQTIGTTFSEKFAAVREHISGIATRAKELGAVGFQKFRTALAGVAEDAKGVAKRVAGIGAAFTAGGILALPKLVSWVGQAIEKTVDAAAALRDTAPDLRLTVERLQELQYWAKQGGAEAGTFEKGFGHLRSTLGDIASGQGKEAADALRKLGLRARDLKPQFANLLLPQIADGLARIKDPALRAERAMAIFGDAGAALLPALLKGSKGIAAASAEARKFGILSQKDVAKAAEFQQARQKLNDAIQSVRTMIDQAITSVALTVGSKLIPVLLPIVEAMRRWVETNREWLATKIADGIQRIADALARVDWKAWGAALQQVGGYLATFTEQLGGIDKVVMLLGAGKLLGPLTQVAGVLQSIASTSLGGKVVTTLGKLVPSFASLGAALAFLVTPLGLVVVGVAGLAAAGLLIYQNWDKIGPLFEQLWETIKGFAEGIAAYLEPVLGPVIAWGKRLWTAFSDLLVEIGGLFADIGTLLGKKLAASLDDAWGYIKTGLGDLASKIGDMLGPALEPMRDAAARVWAGLGEVFQTGIDRLLSYLDPLKSALGSVLGVLKDAVGWVERGLQGIRDTVHGARESVQDAIKAEDEAAAAAQRAADKAALKQRRTTEREAERGPGPWLPEIAAPGGGAPNGTVNVVIDNKNAAPGTRMTTKTTGKGISTQTGVGYSMPQLQPAGAT